MNGAFWNASDVESLTQCCRDRDPARTPVGVRNINNRLVKVQGCKKARRKNERRQRTIELRRVIFVYKSLPSNVHVRTAHHAPSRNRLLSTGGALSDGRRCTALVLALRHVDRARRVVAYVVVHRFVHSDLHLCEKGKRGQHTSIYSGFRALALQATLCGRDSSLFFRHSSGLSMSGSFS